MFQARILGKYNFFHVVGNRDSLREMVLVLRSNQFSVKLGHLVIPPLEEGEAKCNSCSFWEARCDEPKLN